MATDRTTIQQFVEDGLSGRLTNEKHRSQLLLPSNDTHSSVQVTTIVFDNFVSSVLDNQKDSVVAVLSPWGVSSSKLEDALDKYCSTMYAKSNDLQEKLSLFKIDGTKNDFQHFRGFEIAR